MFNISVRKKAIFALIIANVIWGAASPIFKYSLETIPPFTLAFFRFAIATLLILPLVHKELHNFKNEITNWKEIFFYGFAGTTVNITFFFLALRLTDSINAPIIGSTGPILTLIFSILFLREKATNRKILGMVFSFVGILLIIIQPILDSGFSGSFLGNLLLVGATLGAVAQTLIGKNITKKYPPLGLTFWCFLIGTITFLFPAFFELNIPFNFDAKAILGIVFGSLFSSFAAYSLFAWGLSKIEASEAGIFAYIDPIIAIAVAYPLLGEKPSPLFIISALLVFLGIFVAEGRIHYHPFQKLFKGEPTSSN